jgi:hypothetical protein
MVQADIPIAKKRENVKIELQALHFLNKKAIRTRGSRIDFFEQPKNDLHKVIKKKYYSIEIGSFLIKSALSRNLLEK